MSSSSNLSTFANLFRALDDEQPMAYVVPRNSGAVTVEEIVQFVASKVSKLKRLTGGVVFIPSIPKTLVSPGRLYMI
jgi:acyl-coenzyme A synthetase/AMP-(fatty) acid ligase